MSFIMCSGNNHVFVWAGSNTEDIPDGYRCSCGLTCLKRAAEHRDEASGGTSSVPMYYTSEMGDAAHCERCGRLVNSPNYAYHVCVGRRPE
jgi:hypothetical protein